MLGGILPDVNIEDLNEVICVQYSGINDKNGCGIFEEDILRYSSNGEHRYVKVHFHQGSFLFDNRVPSEFLQQYNEVEVAGNVFENEDLLSNRV